MLKKIPSNIFVKNRMLCDILHQFMEGKLNSGGGWSRQDIFFLHEIFYFLKWVQISHIPSTKTYNPINDIERVEFGFNKKSF